MLLRRLLVATVVAATWTASGSSVAASGTPSVHVLYYAANNWVDAVVNGAQPCQGVRRCEWTQSPHVHQLKEKFHREVLPDATTISVAVFHVHSLRDKLNSRYPLNCDWRTNLTLGCSEESGVRYGHLFNATFPNFDGFSSYHPRSSVQRIQHVAYFKEGELRPTLHNFSSLIKAGSYVAKDCHTKGGDRANANRDQVVLSIRQAGFRIDGLSKCMRSQVRLAWPIRTHPGVLLTLAPIRRTGPRRRKVCTSRRPTTPCKTCCSSGKPSHALCSTWRLRTRSRRAT